MWPSIMAEMELLPLALKRRKMVRSAWELKTAVEPERDRVSRLVSRAGESWDGLLPESGSMYVYHNAGSRERLSVRWDWTAMMTFWKVGSVGRAAGLLVRAACPHQKK